ncbi:MAG: single-stranded-DNA-specific exonuclease RecJ [Bacteroidales bacterium]|nr:single-stranded-DNA-specific exonuclease RecJ [Bacteroidales bacterium]
MEKNWIIKEQGNDKEVDALSHALGVDRTIANLLIQRNIKSYEQARAFFRPDLADLHDPYLMKDMDRAVQRIRKAEADGEKIMIYGDYDVDGTTAVSMIYKFLKPYFSALDYYIPDRYREGYGISTRGIDYAAEQGYSLIIALDCGIKAVSKIAYAKEKGIDFIICDHHNPGEEIPDAVAVLDAKRTDCNYPYKELSGCGVGFKLIQACSREKNLPFEAVQSYLDLVVVSIASDIVPITGENRVLAYYGLKQLNENPSIGLRAIMDIAGGNPNGFEIEDIVFKIGPRINAAGRMESGKKAVDLLVNEDSREARIIGEKININNRDRRNIDLEITRQALETIRSNPDLHHRNCTVLFNPEWHKGVIGIVASRLLDYYYRPTVIMTKSNGMATGSARSVNGFDLYQAIEACSDLLENFGGHKYAAGLTMKLKNLSVFSERFETFVNENIHPDQLIPVVEIDTEIPLSKIDEKFYRIIKQFKPFGPENMAPVFLTENVVDNGCGKMVGPNGEHLKLALVQEDNPFRVFPAIAFQQGTVYQKLKNGAAFDICYSLEENAFRGEVNIQLNIKDIKLD